MKWKNPITPPKQHNSHSISKDVLVCISDCLGNPEVIIGYYDFYKKNWECRERNQIFTIIPFVWREKPNPPKFVKSLIRGI